MTPRDEATTRQIEAADPSGSTWLSANAGSGKTRVLTDRVARLLLSGVDPQNILCLTFTKAAASEMQNRLFARLGSWAMMEAGQLRETLRDLGADQPDDHAQARRLFARAIETPGGLKIQTIHAFCAGILRRFPLEAGVSPRFTEIEDRAAELLRAEVLDEIAERDPALMDRFAAEAGNGDVGPLIAAVAGKARAFRHPPPRAELAARFDTDPGRNVAALLAETFPPSVMDDLSALCAACAAGSTNDRKAATLLEPLIARLDVDQAGFETLCGLFLFGARTKSPFGSKAGKFPTGATRTAHADLMDRIDPLMDAVEELRPRVHARLAYERTATLLDFGHAFVTLYEARKRARGVLDFDDLIEKTGDLLSDPATAQWVLFRLDGGIDHILVDEAQDTSPAQWRVIARLTEEMASGAGARADVPRSFFVVGDRKQSIYSFQGADAEAFEQIQAEFEERLASGGNRLVPRVLLHSFRSAPAILETVDAVFTGDMARGLESPVLHRAFKSALPGRVDLWPPVEKVEDADETPWDEPVDRTSPQHQDVRLAERIADEIAEMTRPGSPHRIPDDRDGLTLRPVRPGDVLILVQRRSRLFGEIIRACKAKDLPIAGRDRLKVGAELAVRDLGALLAFLALPEDDLSLACALKSPLFGWTEQELFRLAHDRKGFLWQALRESPAHPGTLAILEDLRAQADFLRPYDLLSRILVRHDGRRRLLARLGAEAEDGIDALLAQALSYERTEVPGLTGFLGWMQTEDVEVKRQMDAQGDQIRVMTVHGAKGLEAPIVILPDTAVRGGAKIRSEIWPMEDSVVWKPPADRMPPVLTAIQTDLEEAVDRERRRLLYVAMTRAEKWLIVCASGDVGDAPEKSWWRAVEAGLLARGARPLVTALGEGLRHQTGDWTGLPEGSATAPPPAPAPAPAFAPLAPVLATRTRSPSDLGGAKTLPGEAEGDPDALDRGTAIHRLLEHLPGWPRADWPALAETLLPEMDAAPLLADAARVLDDPSLTDLFRADALTEAEISADLPGVGRIHGSIDRLIPGETVLAIDFKTNRAIPPRPEDTPPGLLRQMGAYAAALRQVYPGRPVDTAILWTAAPRLMRLPDALVMAALHDAPPA
ncbi:double-strand break repair helicase AddA [Histidinibacterium lentulum]|uniref:DNA 3'-5' helicase n=1 Tax=Histidinibacterium lentulum TaxID=2480588 RepID=A0A3N2R6Z4_9RHOB|nr:double-strand break repair helicase AddA [Histidinibacterium lentulum]ROU03178.1 double-strand break repair helicase AddA [Histidinibacterium lentulum]